MSALSLLLVLLAVASTTLSVNPGVTVRLTDKGLQYGKQLGIAAMLDKLKSIQIPDFSGSLTVFLIGNVKYSLTNIRLVNVGLPRSAVTLVPGTGVRLTIGDAFMNLHGNWRLQYLRVIKNSGSFDVNINGLTISSSIVVESDETGRPVVSSTNCVANVASAKVKLHGGSCWFYIFFSMFINRAVQNGLQKQICPLLDKAVTCLNPKLQTLNVLAKVDKYAEIEYSMVSSPVISQSSIDLNLKGEFYNIGKHQESPFSPAAFSLPFQNNMLYMALSAFTANSAGFVYNKAGILSLYITNDMVPKGSPFQLNTKTFGVFIPQIAKQYPGLMMKLLVRAKKSPTITFQPKNATAVAIATVTAYAIQPNGTLSPLFVLNLESSVSADVYIRGLNISGRLTLNQLKLSVETSYVGQFQVDILDSVLRMVLEVNVIPMVNVLLDKGYPLPALGKINLVNPQLQIMKDYMLIGTDVNFTNWTAKTGRMPFSSCFEP
ncbi:bactericidal permeability-increasing protein-like [Poeciliopsis prolifica]|uniref:bactericidal permeability-increasing protein-like n=1 Tax=Poeciliopsis prolifica TaxID=188132 RepID=UPI0024134966|nr:bactericidal permeability-increasing protein-like [Poeciliopsis prolifica]